MFPRDHNKRAMDSQKPTMLFCLSLPHLLNLSMRRSGSARQKGLPSQKLMVSIKEESGKTSTEMSSCPYIISGNPRDLYGSYNIKDIREADILKTLQNCASQCGANYVSKLKSVWKKIYIVGQRKRVVQTDLSHLVENPRSEIVTERSLNEQNITEEEFELFCQAMSEYGHYLPSEKEKIYNRNIMLYMLKLMRIIGIRSQEVRALRRENFNLVETEIMDGNGNAKRTRLAYVCIKKSIGSSRTELVAEVSTKTPQSVRDIPVTGDGVKLIEEILAYSKHDLVFADYNGDPFSTGDFSDYLYRVSRSCGIKVYSLLMRKSFSADLYREKENPASIKRLMGHKKEDMSLNAYASASREELINATMNRKFKK